MDTNNSNRRDFIKGALVSSSLAITASISQQGQAAENQATNLASNDNQGYLFFNLEEQAWIERLVNHMIPADEWSPKGTDIGINLYIDRALASGWGKGERLYQSGPWKKGLPTQGYQLPLTPANLYKVAIDQSNKVCQKELRL
jgi:gluconate 2-dehydrogenase gamma chain